MAHALLKKFRVMPISGLHIVTEGKQALSDHLTGTRSKEVHMWISIGTILAAVVWMVVSTCVILYGL